MTRTTQTIGWRDPTDEPPDIGEKITLVTKNGIKNAQRFEYGYQLMTSGVIRREGIYAWAPMDVYDELVEELEG